MLPFASPAAVRAPAGITGATVLVLLSGIVSPGHAEPACGPNPRADHLLVSEIRVGPTAFEFVEIHNPTNQPIDLSNCYLYNATLDNTCFYFNVVSGTQCGTASRDSSLRFPAGAVIAPMQYQVIALTGSFNYCSLSGCPDQSYKPDYEVPPTAADDVTVPNMLGVWDQSADTFTTFGFLVASFEDLVLFQWDGVSSTVQDLDYVIWGTNLGVRTDKTGIAGYLPDTPVALQLALPSPINNAVSYQRLCLNEEGETLTGGNGITGHDETSEDLPTTWLTAAPTPKAPTVDPTVGALPAPLTGWPLALGVSPIPIHSVAQLELVLPRAAEVRVTLHDLRGRHVATPVRGLYPAGPTLLPWRPKGLAPGVYYLRLTDGTEAVAHAVVLAR